MKPIQRLFALFFLLSLLLSACGGAATPEPAPKGPYPLPDKFDERYYSWLDHRSGCENIWVSKVALGDASFAGFEIDSERVNTDLKIRSEDLAEAMVTYRIFLTGIRIEDYHVDILNQKVTYLPNPEAGDAQIPNRDAILALTNELAKTAPDIHVGAYYTYLPSKFGTEDWGDDVGLQCDPTNSVIFKMEW